MVAAGDPYKEKLFSINPYVTKREITGKLVVVLQGKLENRGLKLITPISRAVQRNEIHELIVTDEEGAVPGSDVQRIAYLGFMEVGCGGVMVAGDEVSCNGLVLGRIAGFDETHLPNHLNIVVYSPERLDGVERGLRLESEVSVRQVNR
ncbi:DUF6917 domain-containing protein [Desulfotomaculum copahuensis]|uniref:DUF6917 domain-containing protein n=1 Tax=Desulfotomaculum copahuensis TaxID=1838280 RepID=A0A1B7LGK3_9FIRM|nr:hypothetical protein [Desulfotomaculum copahuensis]OAT85231.1 hypothetical protein A6M21_06725 [Desulfotomaculum copahuensis]